MKRTSLKKLQNQVDTFNTIYSVGDKILLKKDNGTVEPDEIKHPASIMGGHTAIAWLVKNGSYLLDRVICKTEEDFI